jgi:MSHA pilin protein MshC
VNRGYTLIELIVSIAIMAILAAIAVPLFNQPQVDSTWFREEVKSAVRFAQRQAVAQRRQVFVVVGTSTVALCYDSGCTARLEQFAPGLSVVNGGNRAYAPGTAYTLVAPAAMTGTLVPFSFSFNGLGQPSPLAGITFNVGSQAVIVTAETGYVQ